MLDDLYDAISVCWSWHWPVAEGEITAIDVERVKQSHNRDTFRLAIAYKFSIGADGPYTGESFWEPAFFSRRRVPAARHKFHLHDPVLVHYRPDDPSVDKIARGVWRDL